MGHVAKTAEKPPFALEGIDHILLLVGGMAPAVRFYTEVLGCTIEDRLPQYDMLQLRAGAALMGPRRHRGAGSNLGQGRPSTATEN
jgi:glyoxylase I family protein